MISEKQIQEAFVFFGLNGKFLDLRHLKNRAKGKLNTLNLYYILKTRWAPPITVAVLRILGVFCNLNWIFFSFQIDPDFFCSSDHSFQLNDSLTVCFLAGLLGMIPLYIWEIFLFIYFVI